MHLRQHFDKRVGAFLGMRCAHQEISVVNPHMIGLTTNQDPTYLAVHADNVQHTVGATAR